MFSSSLCTITDFYGKDFDGENLETFTPLTKKSFDLIIKRIKEIDEYATI